MKEKSNSPIKLKINQKIAGHITPPNNENLDEETDKVADVCPNLVPSLVWSAVIASP